MMRFVDTKKNLGVLLAVSVLLAGCEASDTNVPEMRIQSPAFGQEEEIPLTYTFWGSKISPPLSFSVPPNETKSLAVIMDDPDYSSGTRTHWLVWGLPPNAVLAENAQKDPPESLVFGTADDIDETVGYLAPQPPAGDTHRYVFQVYALDKNITLKTGAHRNALDTAMEGHILAKGELVGTVLGRKTP